MTTINGITFNMGTILPVATHRNNPSAVLGADESFINDMGYDGLIIRVTGFESTLAKYDEVIAEFMKSGEQTLVYRTGWQLSVHSTSLAPLLDAGIVDNWFPYDLIMITGTPYRNSTSETTRSKTINAQDQEWSQDDSTNNISTTGNVDAKPVIELTGGQVSAVFGRSAGILNTNTDAAEHDTLNTTWTLKKTFTYSAHANRGWIIDTLGVSMVHNSITNEAHGKYTYQAASLNGGAETDVPGASWVKVGGTSTSFSTYSETDINIQCAGNELLTVRFYLKSNSGSNAARSKDYNSRLDTHRKYCCKNPVVYNIADDTIQQEIANEVEYTAIHRIDINGTGTVEYSDTFTSDKYLDAAWVYEDETYDDPNDKLDLATEGYIEYKHNCKYPINGTPTLIATIDTITGTPTIQVAKDEDGVPGTYYDIDTAIVDDVSTTYDLKSGTDVVFKDETIVYYRINSASATCSIKSLELDINTRTIDAEHPKITTGGGASTFKCNQDTVSGLNCIVGLIYRHRSWIG